MYAPLTKVLIKIFAKGFYKVHSGFLLFLFVTCILYCFYTPVLNETHLSKDQRLLSNLSLTLTLISSPVTMGLAFILWLLYSVKSWKYVTAQFTVESHHFLYYSVTSLSRINQFKSWFIVQLIITLPIVIIGMFSLVIGIIFNFYTIPLIILLYIVLLAALSAMLYVRNCNQPIDVNKQAWLRKISKNIHKPLSSLFLFHIINKHKVALLITKSLSWFILICGIYLFEKSYSDLRVAGMVILLVTMAHTILIFHSYEFETIFLNFLRNLPYRRSKLYLNYITIYLVMMMPETIWLLVNYQPIVASGLLLFSVSLATIFHSILYRYGLDMKVFLPKIFYIFLVMFILILFHLFWGLIILNFLVSFTIFYLNYYKQKT